MSEDRSAKRVERILHDAHLRYQREQLAPEDTTLPDGSHLGSPEVRGVKRKLSKAEIKAMQFKPEWFSHLRPNFWKAYFGTLLYMTK